MISARLEAALELRLGTRVLRAEQLAGGDINSAYLVECAGLGRVFVKTQERAPAELFSAEADGLEWLREARALRIPEVLAFTEPGQDPPHYLVLEYIEPGRPAGDFDVALGQGLAALHRAGAPSFGLPRPNFIGLLPQDNTPAPTWAEFYRTRRLEPLLQRALKAGQASYAMRRGFDKLFARLPELVSADEPASRLHGDLWGGNLHVGERGEPCLIDPAVYGGHREMDLAMMRLFGGFSERVFSVYEEAFPLQPGAALRVPLYQLYPLLVHTVLFGGSYGASVERALARYA